MCTKTIVPAEMVGAVRTAVGWAKTLGAVILLTVIVGGCADATPSATSTPRDNDHDQESAGLRVEVPLPTASPLPMRELLGSLAGEQVADAPPEAVAQVRAAFGRLTDQIEDERHLVVLDSQNGEVSAGISILRVHGRGGVADFRSYWMALMIDRFGVLRAGEIEGETVLTGESGAGGVVLWQPDVRTFVTIVGADEQATVAAARELVRPMR